VSDSDHDRLYFEFTERLLETGDREIPGSWPDDVRERCRFFLQVMDLGSEAAASPDIPIEETENEGIPEPGADILEAGPPAPRPLSDGRYTIEGEIARGGMGRILLTHDRNLRRRIAMKVMLDPEGGARSRFLAEAQATAQLEHPNICPVYDLGVDPEGRAFFTMKLVHGRTLKEIIGAGDHSLTRMVQILQGVAMGVDFAHSRGVVHRDLKPSNVMIGDYGEVLVMDWGLAKIARRSEGGGGDAPEAISTARKDLGAITLDGAIQGSIPYMAPEQARGEAAAVDEATDVFGLGAILYEVLCGAPPHPEEDSRMALARARRGDVVPPRARAPGRDIPSALEDLCLRALSPAKEDRPSAREIHDALQRYIEGIHDAERRAADARRLAEAAAARVAEHRSARGEAAAIEARRRDLLAAVHDHDSEEEKAGLWRIEEELEEARGRAEAAFRDAASTYQAVLNVDPGHRPARSALADLYLEKMDEAEARGDREAAGLYAGLVAHYHDGRHGARLRGDGELTLDSRPSGAEAILFRYRERGRRLVEEGGQVLGKTPLRRELPMGSYLLVLRSPGLREVRYPLLVERCGRHEAVVTLHPEASIPPGFIFVPGGPAIVGGDSESFRPLPRGRPGIPDLFVGEYPVTFGEYCAFLNDPETVQEGFEDLLPLGDRDRYTVVASGGTQVPRLDPACPVLGIPVSAAMRYCRWLGRRIGRPVRLLTEIEWEKCARGADGRIFPWGNRFDWSFTKGGRSRKGQPSPEPVGRFSADHSPYGIRDLAGCVREFTADLFAENHRACRGGSWFNGFEITFRADMRTYCREGNRVSDIGFRVAFGGGAEGGLS
jgi:formylglycine-generating enzyme required for sulfatase activity